MGIAQLRAAIEAEGRQRVTEIRRAAAEQAGKLREAAKAEAAHRHDVELDRRAAALRAETSRRLALARRDAQRRVLEARERFLDRVFAAVAEALPDALASTGVATAWASGVEKALAYLPPGPATIVCSPALTPTLEAALAGRGDVHLEPDPDLPLGFRATSADGRLVVDATWAALLEQQRPALAIELLRRLAEDRELDAVSR